MKPEVGAVFLVAIRESNTIRISVQNRFFLKISFESSFLIKRHIITVLNFHQIGPLGQFDLVVAISVCCPFVCLSPFHVLDF